jgi:hypothetical protein
LIFEGGLVVFKRVPPLLEAARLIDGWIGRTLGSITEVDLDAIDGLRNRFRGEPEVTALFRAGLEHVGVDASRSYWDSLYLRVVPPVDPGAGRQIGRIGPHRDTWSSNVPQQTNWWTARHRAHACVLSRVLVSTDREHQRRVGPGRDPLAPPERGAG